jgi:hypothetical protein
MISTRIRQHERGLHFRHGDFKRLLAPGKHRFWSRLWSGKRDVVQVYSTLETKFEHALLDVLAARDEIRDALHLV